MLISHLRLENWRNFTKVDVALEQRTFLIGPNASGKSNFLDALRFLRDLSAVGGGFEKAVTVRGGVSHLRSLSARRYPAIVLDVDIENGGESTWRYRLAFTQDNQRRPIITDERVWRAQKLVLQRPNPDDVRDRERLRQTHLEQVSANLLFRPVSEFFASIRYHHIVPQLVREPERWQSSESDPFGGDFVERVIRTPAPTRNARLRRIERALAVAVPQLSGLRVERDEHGVAHVSGKYEHWRPQGAWQTEVDFSDGTIRLLGLLWALIDGTGPLLLEEPELSLHPDVVRYIPQLMARVQGRSARQILVSTHSTDLLSDPGIATDEVLILVPSREGTAVRVAQEIAEVHDLVSSGLSLAETVLPFTRPGKSEQLSFFPN